MTSTSYFSSILLKWSEIDPEFLSSSSAPSYQVFFSKGVNKSKSDLTPVGGKQTVTFFEVTGLTPATSYSFAVAAVSQNITGPKSTIIYASTLTGINLFSILFTKDDLLLTFWPSSCF